MSDENECDVVVIGGGAAGLSGALTLARARRSVLVVDSGQPRNAPASGVHGLLGQDGVPPVELLARGRAEVASYGGEVTPGEVVTAAKAGDRFVVRLADGSEVTARRLLVTAGLVDELPDVAGVRERWGRDVIHCPYCHGWEVRDRAIAVLGGGPMSVHQALLVRQWSDDVVFFPRGQELDDDVRHQLAARGIDVIEGDVAALEIADDAITGVRLADGTVVAREAVMVGPRMVARAAFLRDLGLVPQEHPAGEHLGSDELGRTAVPGVWAAGNVTDLSANVPLSIAQGMWAAAQINADLVAEETAAAVAVPAAG